MDTKESPANSLLKFGQWHDAAMECVDRAERLKKMGSRAMAIAQLTTALQFEMAALMLAPSKQLTQAILARSAASLAYLLDNNKLANMLVEFGLSNKPHSEIDAELRDLRDNPPRSWWSEWGSKQLPVTEDDVSHYYRKF